MRAKNPARRAGGALIWLHRNNVAISQWQNPQFAEEATGGGRVTTASRVGGISMALCVRPGHSVQRALPKPRLQRSNIKI